MKWGLVGKGGIPHISREAEELLGLLRGRGQDVILEDDLANAIGEDGTAIGDMDCDMFLTVGGDGTILHAMQHTDKPVLGINAGAIGFLAEVEPPMAAEAIDKVLAGDFRIDERRRLSATLDGEPLGEALNEVTLQTSRIAKLIRFEVRVDEEILDTFRGDGIILATTTGSTGYSMSVGGPLVHPAVRGTVIAPIAPFRLSARPWVVPCESIIDVTLLDRDSAQGVQQARLVMDGQRGFDMATGATLRVQPSNRRARFVRFGSGFYERVRTKLTR